MKKVFFVDDDRFVTSLYKAKLQSEGIHINVANSGEEAIDRLPSLQPDLLVLDLHMPEINGVDVLRFIRGHEQLKNLPVIIFSTGFVQALIEEVGDLGAQKFFAKTQCTPKKLVEEIKDSLQAIPETPQAPIEEHAPAGLEAAAENAPPISAAQLHDLFQMLCSDTNPEVQRSRLVSIYKSVRPTLDLAMQADASTPRGKLSRALKNLLEDLYAHPDHMTPSTTKTLIHGLQKLIDLCAKADRSALNSEVTLKNVLADLDD